jgi:integrase
MTNPNEKRGRPRKGSLVWAKSGWRARVTVEVDGETIQRTIDLGTTIRAVAKRKLARIVAEHASPEAIAEATKPATVSTYAEGFFEGREARGVTSSKKEKSIFTCYWEKAIGHLLLADVRANHVRSVLEDVAQGKVLGQRGERLAKRSIAGLREVVRQLFDSAWQEELIPENPVARVKLKTMCPKDSTKSRTVLSDVELGRLLAHPIVNPEIKMLALLGRTIGGQRTSDLHSLDWTAFGADFATCIVPRHKTRHERGGQELEVPEPVRPFIAAWWRAHGSPTSGPVFPVRIGKRAGQPKSLRNSYATKLRECLYAAGVTRHVCTRPAALKLPNLKTGEACCPAMALDPLFTETADSLRVDFHHTTRGGYSTAMAVAGVNVQTAQVLAGHSDPKVHQRYIAAATIRALPAAALPPIPSLSSAEDDGFSAEAPQKFEGGVSESPLILGSSCKTRTCDPAVNSRLLYRLS